MYLGQIEKLTDVLFFLIDQTSDEELDLLRNGNLLYKLSSKLGESSENYAKSPENEECEKYSENNLNFDSLKTDDENEEVGSDEEVEELSKEEKIKEGEMTGSDFSAEFEDEECEPETSKTPVRIKIKKEKKPSSAKCRICDEDVDDLEKHDVDHHMEGGKFKCEEGCDFISEEKKSLVEHFAIVHKEIDVFKCPDCGEMFFNMKPLANHLIKHHGIDIPLRTCPICMNTFATNAKYRSHLEHQHRTFRKCNQCNKYYRSKGALNAHIKLCHEAPDIACHICGKTTKSKDNFELHMKKHKNEEKTVKCSECDKHFFTNFEMKKHISRVHKTDRFLCCQCDYSTAANSILKRHIRSVHSDERNFICGTCGAAFKQKISLTQHEVSIHLNQRNFECEVCGKKFKRSSNLGTHRRIHTGDYAASCEKCGKQFVQNCNYKLHKLKCFANAISC